MAGRQESQALNPDSGGGSEVSQEGYVCGVAEWRVRLKRERICMPDQRVS